MEQIIKIGLCLLFIGCLAHLPYGYFQLVRILGVLGFGFLAFHEKEKGNQALSFLWLGSAVLINPIFKVSLGRGMWNIIDIIWIILLVSSLLRK